MDTGQRQSHQGRQDLSGDSAVPPQALQTIPEIMLQLAQERWMIEGLNVFRDTLCSMKRRSSISGKCAGALARLRKAVLNRIHSAEFKLNRSEVKALVCAKMRRLPITQVSYSAVDPPEPEDQDLFNAI